MEDEAAANKLIEDINKYLKGKSVEVRKKFYLYYSLDLTIREIVVQLGMSESNVKNKLYRTLSELNSKFKMEGEL